MTKAIRNTVDLLGKGPFRLVRWFAVVSLLVILLISVASSIALSKFMTHVLLHRDAVLAANFINTQVRAANALGYFERNHVDALTPEVERFFTHLAYLPDVIRADIYSSERVVVWSSDTSLIGQQFGPNKELERAFSGALSAEVEDSEHDGKAEHYQLGKEQGEFLENYLPIWDANYERVVAVAEIYRMPASLFQEIAEGRRLVWVTSLAAGVALFVGLIWLVNHANKVLERQNQLIVERGRMAAIGEMAASVAHGLRNPLASIRSSAELVLDEPDSHPSRESLSDIVDQVDRLDSWISALLSRSKGGATPGDQGVNINDTIADCIDAFTTQFTNRGIKLDCALLADNPRIHIDENRIRQILNTLVSNSIEAMPDGGNLSIRTNLNEIGTVLWITVTDSGCGLPESVGSRLFEPFVTTKRNGLGVGLNLAKSLLDGMGGHLRLSNNGSGGVTAIVEVPLQA